MAKVWVDPGTWSQQRFGELCSRTRCERPTALGIILMLWARTRAGGMDVAQRGELEDLLPVHRKRRAEWFDALLEFGYLQRLGDEGFIVEGNAKYFDRQDQWRAAGRARQAQARAIRAGEIEPPKRRAAEAVAIDPETKAAQSARMACWQAYVDAYQKRYRIKPTRSAVTNNLVRAFVDRVGQTAAPSVIRFYVGHHELVYMRALHPIKMAVRDAEQLAQQWAAGQLLEAARRSPERPGRMRQASLWEG